jgi:hypothetical protein
MTVMGMLSMTTPMLREVFERVGDKDLLFVSANMLDGVHTGLSYICMHSFRGRAEI